MKAVAYVRVSTLEQAREGVSLDAQTERLEAYCKMQDLELVAMIREEAVSGSVPLDKRPGGQELLRLVKTKQIEHIVALKLDRLFRNTEDCLKQTSAWDKAGIALHLIDMGGQTINTASAIGRMFLTMTAAFAQLERDLIRERTRAALQYKKKHLENYGTLPYGYQCVEGGLVLDMKEQEVISLMKQWRRDDWSLREIANDLNDRAVETKRGGKWFASTVRYVLANKIHEEAA